VAAAGGLLGVLSTWVPGIWTMHSGGPTAVVSDLFYGCIAVKVVRVGALPKDEVSAVRVTLAVKDMERMELRTVVWPLFRG
jgi:hypothetical protein